jgi:hypothetical protein
VSTTAEVKLNWDLSYVYQNEFTLDSLLKTLEVIDTFKRKYPNDDIVEKFEIIIRNEICMMFGGSLNSE